MMQKKIYCYFSWNLQNSRYMNNSYPPFFVPGDNYLNLSEFKIIKLANYV